MNNWNLIWEGKKVIRYQNVKDRNTTLEIYHAKINNSQKWFVTKITKDKILDFPETNSGVTKRDARKIATLYMFK